MAHFPRTGWSVLVLLSLLFTGVIGGCDKDLPVDPNGIPEPVTPDIDTLAIPTFWVYQSTHFRTLRVRLELPETQANAVTRGDLQPPRVSVLLFQESAQSDSIRFFLHDDGGARTLTDQPPFLDARSGDLVPLDLTFSARMNAFFAPFDGDYQAVVTVGWFTHGAEEYPAGYALASELELRVEVNSPPVIESFTHSDSLPAGFEEHFWVAEVSEPDRAGGDAVVLVEMDLLRDDAVIRNLLMAHASGDFWQFTMRPTFAAGLQTGEYSLRLYATDRFDQASEPLYSAFWVENTPPEIDDFTTPDTVYRPEGEDPEPNVYAMFVTVADLQGQGDIQRVEYFVVDPHGDIFQSSEFVFNDIGLPPDEEAGDGRWSHGFRVDHDVSNFGTYTFTVTAYDRAGNQSNNLVALVELVNTGGGGR